MPDSNRRFTLRSRPKGRITPDTFELVEEPIPEVGEGQALVQTQWISLDPTNRTWIREEPTYLPPVGIGEVMRGLGLGRVVASKHDAYREGQLVQGLVGWQEWTLASEAAPLLPVAEMPGVPPSMYLGALGMTGLTAWVGLQDIGRPQPGETVLVSAAAGAVGSVAAQIAKIKGARVVGIAGGPEKCALLTERLGLDAAVDHRTDDWYDTLVEATPDGVDVDFENVGGAINDAEPPPGPRSFANLLVQRAKVEGLIVLDHLHRITEAAPELAAWIQEGKLEPLETVVEGFEQLPTAINMLFDGANVGKLVVRVAD